MAGLLFIVLIFAAFPLGSRVDLWTRIEKSPIVESVKNSVSRNASTTAEIGASVAGDSAVSYWNQLKVKADTEVGVNIPKFGKWTARVFSNAFSRLASFLASWAN